MKGLMFNVLESLANEAGCSDEAWELVVEFAAAESLLEQAAGAAAPVRTSRPPLSYASPTEAMVRCLSQGDLGERRYWDLLDAAQHREWYAPEWTGTPTARATSTEAATYGAGFSAEAFLEPDVLIGNWRQDPSTETDEEEANRWIREQKAAHKRRG